MSLINIKAVLLDAIYGFDFINSFDDMLLFVSNSSIFYVNNCSFTSFIFSDVL